MLKRSIIIVTEHYPAQAEFRAVNLDKRTGADIRASYGSGVYAPPFEVRADRTLLDIPFDLGGGTADSRGHLRSVIFRGTESTRS